MEVLQSDKLSTNSVIPTKSQPCNCRPISGYSCLLHMRYFTEAQSWGFHRKCRCQTGSDPVLTSGCTLSELQINLMPLFTTLWHQPFSQFLTILCLPTQPIIHHLLSLWGSYGRQCQKTYWNQGRQCPQFSPHSPSQSFHCRRLSGWSSMTSSF